MWRRTSSFRPFATRGRGATIAIIAMFALFSAVSVALSIRETSRSRHSAIVVEIAGRQRTLAERYVREVMLVQGGGRADPATTATLLHESADTLTAEARRPASTATTTRPTCPRPRAWRASNCSRSAGSRTT